MRAVENDLHFGIAPVRGCEAAARSDFGAGVETPLKKPGGNVVLALLRPVCGWLCQPGMLGLNFGKWAWCGRPITLLELNGIPSVN